MEGRRGNVTASGYTFGVTTDRHVIALAPGARRPMEMSGSAAIAARDRAVEGSGGGFLSNEIFYRTLATIRASTHRTIPMIHLHTPALNYGLAPTAFGRLRTAIVRAVRRILIRALPQL
jgi:hypothetical protein